MRYIVELNNRVIEFTNEPQADGYICGFDLAETDRTPEGQAAWKFIFERLEQIDIQVKEAPEKRGQLRKKPKPGIIDQLLEVTPNV